MLGFPEDVTHIMKIFVSRSEINLFSSQVIRWKIKSEDINIKTDTAKRMQVW